MLAPVAVPMPLTVSLPQTQIDSYTGGFYLYDMRIPSLVDIYQGAGSGCYYDALLDALQHRHDTKKGFTAQVQLPHWAHRNQSGYFSSDFVKCPRSETPFTITLDSIAYKKTVTFSPTERTYFPPSVRVEAYPCDGMTAKNNLRDGTCGMRSFSGVFKLKTVYGRLVGPPDRQDVQELFQGSFSLHVSYDAWVRRKGYDARYSWKFGFWAIATRDVLQRPSWLC